MNVAELLEKRRTEWQELEDSIAKLQRILGRRRMNEVEIARFTSLYRGACADLALAESYRLPPGIIRYLNNLVGRAHNQLYCDQTIGWSALPKMLFRELPRRIFSDGAFWSGMLLFWIPFLVCAALAANMDGFAEQVVGRGTMRMMENMYSRPLHEHSPDERMVMYGYYIFHNSGIGLQCFAAGAFFMATGILITLSNAIYLGTIFGHMATTPQSANFYEFVVAHGPFELTAIAISAGAGLRIGFSCISTGGLNRVDSMKKAAKRVFPVVLFAVFLFCCAACLEAFVSPSGFESLESLGIPPVVCKRAICLLCAFLLFGYIVILGGMQWLRNRLETIESLKSTEFSKNPQRAF
ncbi:MAG: stage II sporulation protein M [Planctomycetaceae bacterium]|jgi:uncharacterized membrane protein SpoIIM required for sporulation|nr:stage II sporulation protein M [Planctomycetaceae bacterium]